MAFELRLLRLNALLACGLTLLLAAPSAFAQEKALDSSGKPPALRHFPASETEVRVPPNGWSPIAYGIAGGASTALGAAGIALGIRVIDFGGDSGDGQTFANALGLVPLAAGTVGTVVGVVLIVKAFRAARSGRSSFDVAPRVSGRGNAGISLRLSF